MAYRGGSAESRGRGRGSSQRGGWHYRGRGSGGRGGRGGNSGHPSQASYSYQTQTPISRASEPLGPTIDSINIKTLLVDEESPKVENCEYVASYNWTSGNAATILVPGSPPAWTPPATDTKLNPDSGAVFRDLNAARWPQHPLEPAVRSLQTMRPDFDLASVDIFGCGHTMGYLLKAVRGDPIPFRFDVDVVGDTVFFVRKGSTPTERITDLRGYGFRFPETYTTWDMDVRNSASHQRTINYTFGGLQILLRSGTDGYQTARNHPALRDRNYATARGRGFAAAHGRGLLAAQNAAPTSPPQVNTSLEDTLITLSVSGADLPGNDNELRLELAKGRIVPQSDIFDIKTRSKFNPIKMEDILPGLWLNQTPNFLVAYHEYGLFDRPRVTNLRSDILEWEEVNSHLLAMFHAVVKRVIDVVRGTEKKQCEVSWDGTGQLVVTEQVGEGRRALPSDLHQVFTE